MGGLTKVSYTVCQEHPQNVYAFMSFKKLFFLPETSCSCFSVKSIQIFEDPAHIWEARTGTSIPYGYTADNFRQTPACPQVGEAGTGNPWGPTLPYVFQILCATSLALLLSTSLLALLVDGQLLLIATSDINRSLMAAPRARPSPRHQWSHSLRCSHT